MTRKVYELSNCKWHGEDPKWTEAIYPKCTFDQITACSLKLGKTCPYVSPGMKKYLKERKARYVKSNLDI